MKTIPRWLALLLLLASPLLALASEQPEATLKVTGRKVEVQVRHADGRPASRARIRLLYGRQLTVVAASTDDEGRWSGTLERTGAYELVAETGPGEADVVRVAFAALDAEEEAQNFQPVPAVSGAGCILAAVVLVLVRKRGTRASPRLGWKAASAALVLLLAGGALLGWAARPRGQAAGVDEPDVARAAREYLNISDVKPLSGPLERLLADPAGMRVPTQAHPLLGTPAPDFELTDHRGKTWRLQEQLSRGPVVLVFYYGYHCNHCVGQLFALHDDTEKFREMGAQVVAISADPPELTRQRFRQYGEFSFPVLTDPGNRIAQAFGVCKPASGNVPEDLEHGTFVIGREGRVHWTQHGSEPFTGNLTLLFELARLEGRLPFEGRRER